MLQLLEHHIQKVLNITTNTVQSTILSYTHSRDNSQKLLI